MIEKIGRPAMLEQLAEEASELAQACRAITPYRDVVLDRRLNAGETLTMESSRAQYVAGFGYIKIIGEVGA